MKIVEGSERNNVILYIIYMIILRQTHGHLEQAKVIVYRPGI